MSPSLFPLRWTSLLSIDGQRIDEQHRSLFDLYNQVLDQSDEAISRKIVLDALLDYSVFHFREEEAYMRSISYPSDALGRHVAAHQEFSTELARLSGGPPFQTLDFFRQWLLRHIMTDDLKIRTFLKSHPTPDR